MVAILIDPKYAKSLWCKNLCHSLTEQLRRRRIPFCEIRDSVPDEYEVVFMIASDYQWIESAIHRLNLAGIQPILLCNQPGHFPGRLYSCVHLNIDAGMRSLLNRLRHTRKRRPTIYGVNPHSVSDLNLVESLLAWRGEEFAPMRVFVNDGSLKRCFEDFYPCVGDFDSVICTNDFAAVSLIRNLREKTGRPLRDIGIVSCIKSEISEYYRQDIVSLSFDFEQFGRAAVYVYDSIRKHPYVSNLSVGVNWGTEEMVRHTARLDFSESTDAFYQDPELQEMLIVDKLLKASDETDRQIVNDLLDGCSYESITERRFLAEGTIKYRLKKMFAACGTNSREELLRLTRKYIGRI